MQPQRLSYANVMSTLGVFIALGGTSYAVARNSVGEKQLKRDAVTSPKVKDGTLTAADLAVGALSSGARGPRGTQGPAGPVGADGPIGPRGPSDARVATSLDVPLPLADSYVTALVLQAVPPGSYVAVFTGEAYYRPTSEPLRATVSCQTLIDGVVKSTTQAIVGEDVGASGTIPLADVIPIMSPSPFDASVRCRHSLTTVQQAKVLDPELAIISVETLAQSG